MSVVIDPAYAAVVGNIPAPPPLPADGSRPLERVVADLRSWSRGQLVDLPPVTFDGTREDIGIPTCWGRLAARVYRPHGTGAPGGTAVWFHGGGMILGDLDKADRAAAELAATSGLTVVSTTYRLAPEHPFPAGPADAYDVLTWVAAHGSELGLDPGRLAVGGESAGGSMATAAALQAARRGGPHLCFQLLAYPKVDFTRRYPSADELADVGIPQDLADVFDRSYLPEPELRSDPLASPVLADPADLARMPAGLILAAEGDTLRDEAEQYGRLLRAAGAPVATVRAAGQIHGFLDFTAAVASARIIARSAYLMLGDAVRAHDPGRTA